MGWQGRTTRIGLNGSVRGLRAENGRLREIAFSSPSIFREFGRFPVRGAPSYTEATPPAGNAVGNVPARGGCQGRGTEMGLGLGAPMFITRWTCYNADHSGEKRCEPQLCPSALVLVTVRLA